MICIDWQVRRSRAFGLSIPQSGNFDAGPNPVISTCKTRRSSRKTLNCMIRTESSTLLAMNGNGANGAGKSWQASAIEIHCDMGEAYGNWKTGDDELIMPHINVASIACGYHAGDPSAMRETVRLAKKYSVRTGAHPSYLDIQGFGRRVVQMEENEITDMVTYQIGALKAFLDAEGVPLNHVSPHGALWGKMCKDEKVSDAVCRAIAPFNVHLYGASGTFMESSANKLNIPFVQEVVPDVDYDDNGDCIITRTHEPLNLKEYVQKLQTLMSTGKMLSKNGKEIDMNLCSFPFSLCIHSDTPGASDIAKVTREEVDKFNARFL